MGIYQKHPWIIPIVPFVLLFIIVHGIISYFLTMFCPLKVWTSFNRFGSKMVSWIPKEEIMREFSHAGFKCLVHKEKSGSLHGYVILPKEHPYYGKPPWDIPDEILFSLPEAEGLSLGTPPPGKEPWKVEISTHDMFHTVDFVVNKTRELAEQLERRNEVFTPP